MRVLRSHLVALLPVVALSTVLGAQTGGSGGVIRASAGPATATPHRDIPAVAARALIAAHHADVVDGTVDPAIVTLVLDNGNNYVASAVSKPAVVVQGANGSVAAAGGFATATPTVIASGSGAAASAGEGSTPRATMTIAGIGPIDPAAVEEMFWTTYPAGEIGPVAVRVRFVILKATK